MMPRARKTSIQLRLIQSLLVHLARCSSQATGNGVGTRSGENATGPGAATRQTGTGVGTTTAGQQARTQQNRRTSSPWSAGCWHQTQVLAVRVGVRPRFAHGARSTSHECRNHCEDCHRTAPMATAPGEGKSPFLFLSFPLSLSLSIMN